MRQFEKLIGKNLKSLPAGKHGDGRGLYMVVEPSGARRWMFRYKSREMGLGGFPGVTLASAREKAQRARESLDAGRDPIAARKTANAGVPTFGAMADLMLAKKSAEGLSKGQMNGWRLSLETYCLPIRSKRVNEIAMQEVIDIVRPVIDAGKHSTAERLRPRIAAVFDMAKSLGHREGDNPAAWKGGLAYHLPSRPAASRGHHDAMPWPEVPSFYARLKGRPAMSALALRFLILTGLRCSEVLGARWEEIDRSAKHWTVPASRMKKKNAGAHRVPLSEPALAILDDMAALAGGADKGLIFPGVVSSKTSSSRPMSINVFRALMRRMGVSDATSHGFRASFKTWALESTAFQWEVIEAALHHAVGNSVQAAYIRGDNLDKRVALMDAWAEFLEGEAGGNVVSIRGAVGA